MASKVTIPLPHRPPDAFVRALAKVTTRAIYDSAKNVVLTRTNSVPIVNHLVGWYFPERRTPTIPDAPRLAINEDGEIAPPKCMVLLTLQELARFIDNQSITIHRVITPQPEGAIDTSSASFWRTGYGDEAAGLYGPLGQTRWFAEPFIETPSPPFLAYQVDGEDRTEAWKPSMAMRSRHARLLGQLTSFECHRLQELPIEDYGTVAGASSEVQAGARAAFHARWDATILNRSKPTLSLWVSNPWVWRATFRRLTSS